MRPRLRLQAAHARAVHGRWAVDQAAIPLALAYNPVVVFGISAGAVALWLLVWALLFRGRLGLG